MCVRVCGCTLMFEHLYRFISIFACICVHIYIYIYIYIYVQEDVILFSFFFFFFISTIYMYIYACVYMCVVDRLFGLVGIVFANGPGDMGSISGRVIPKTLKMVLDTSLLNTQHYKVRINVKVQQSRRSNTLPYPSVQQLLKRELSTTVVIFTYLYVCMCVDECVNVVHSISFQPFFYKHLNLSKTHDNSVCYCYTSYEMTDQFL